MWCHNQPSCFFQLTVLHIAICIFGFFTTVIHYAATRYLLTLRSFIQKLLKDVSNTAVAFFATECTTPGVISSTYSIWVVFVIVSGTGTSALNINISSFSSRYLMCNGQLLEFWTCFDKPNETLITSIYMQNDNHNLIWRRYTSFFVTMPIFLFQVCRIVILMLLLAQCHKNILRPLQPLSFTLCDRSSFNSYRHNQFLNVTVYVSDLCCLLLFWTLVASCFMPSIISCLVYNFCARALYLRNKICPTLGHFQQSVRSCGCIV